MKQYYYKSNLSQYRKAKSRKRKGLLRFKQLIRSNKLVPLVILYVALIVVLVACVTVGSVSANNDESSETTTVEEVAEDTNTNPRSGSATITSEVLETASEEPKKEFVEIIRDSSESIFMEKNYFEALTNNTYTFDCVNVRTTPSTNGEIFITLPANTYVTRLNVRDDGWSEVVFENHIYYINSYYVGADDEHQAYLEAEAAKDTTPYNDELVEKWGFSYDLQKYLWQAVCEYTEDRGKRENYYCYLLGVMQHESSLGSDKSNYNSNGTRDLGIMQVNSSNWKELKEAGIISDYSISNLTCDELQYDNYTGIDAGMYFLNDIVSDYGITEQSYYVYNTGRKGDGSNKNSRKVYSYYKNWLSTIYGV